MAWWQREYEVPLRVACHADPRSMRRCRIHRRKPALSVMYRVVARCIRDFFHDTPGGEGLSLDEGFSSDCKLALKSEHPTHAIRSGSAISSSRPRWAWRLHQHGQDRVDLEKMTGDRGDAGQT